MTQAGNSYVARNEVDGGDIFMTPRNDARDNDSSEPSPIRVISLRGQQESQHNHNFTRLRRIERDYQDIVRGDKNIQLINAKVATAKDKLNEDDFVLE